MLRLRPLVLVTGAVPVSGSSTSAEGETPAVFPISAGMIAAVISPLPGKLGKIAAPGCCASRSRVLTVIARAWWLSSSSWPVHGSSPFRSAAPGETRVRVRPDWMPG